MELTAAIALLVAAIAPFITALFTRPNLSDGKKRAVAGLVAIVLAVLTTVASGTIQGTPPEWSAGVSWFLVSAAIIIAAAQAFYAAWKPAVEVVEANVGNTEGRRFL